MGSASLPWLQAKKLASRSKIVHLLPLAAGLRTFADRLPAVLVGSVMAWSAQRQARLRYQEQIKATRQRRITRAIEQLDSDKVQVRLGSIYTLERISRESEQAYWTTVETLTQLVQNRTRLDNQSGTYQKPDYSLAAVEAVLAVIKQRNSKNDRHDGRKRYESWRRDLSSANLRHAVLWTAHLEGADLSNAHLEGARLWDAHLEGADLSNAHLEGTLLFQAHLEGANLSNAHLEGAYLWNAYLEGADLSRGHLKGAILIGTHLEGADLTQATGLNQGQLDRALGSAETSLPQGLTHPLHWLSEQSQSQSTADVWKSRLRGW